jgi:hypothetical protein
MAKTRLLTSDREAIERAVIKHKFEPLEQAAAVTEGALAVEAYQRGYGVHVPYLAKAPKGAFLEANNFRLNVGGRVFRLQFSPERSISYRFFYKHKGDWTDLLELDVTDELGQRIIAHAENKDQLVKDKTALTKVVSSTLAQFRTFDDLLTGWPEAESFIKARWQTRPDYKANVPAVVIKDLSAQLDLPPETQKAA